VFRDFRFDFFEREPDQSSLFVGFVLSLDTSDIQCIALRTISARKFPVQLYIDRHFWFCIRPDSISVDQKPKDTLFVEYCLSRFSGYIHTSTL